MKIFKKEHEVVKLAMNYLEAVTSCLEPAAEAVTAHFNGDFLTTAKLWPKVASLETEADVIRREIEDKLFSGAYLPLMRGDICSIIESLDAVCNAAEACCGFFAGEKPEVPDELKAPFVQITADSFGIMSELAEAVERFFKPKDKIRSIREHVKAVGDQESAVDAQEWKITQAIFGADSLDLARKLHLKQALSRIVEVPDRAEDAAEMLALVSMKSVL